MTETPQSINLSLLKEAKVRVLLWSQQFKDPSPALYICEQRHWREFFDPLSQGVLGNRLAVILPENLSGMNLRQISPDAECVLIPLRPESIFSPTYGEILHGRDFFGPVILVATTTSIEFRQKQNRPVPAEVAEGIISPADVPLPPAQ
jgi:hypothetical protein